MSNSGSMFDGNGELMPGYTYGTFNSNPVPSTSDFQRAFPVVADKILFITGDLSIWGIADYGDLRALIDAQGSVPPFSPNLAFEIGVNGVISNTTGNVISRSGALEDPWISMEGDHFYGVNNQRFVWGENNWNYQPGHVALKNNHGGINVYVKAADAGGSYSGDEGSAIAMSGATASDADLDVLTYAWTVDSALCSFNDASALNPNLTCSDNGSYNASAGFTDPGTLDTHSAVWNWGDFSTSGGAITEINGNGAASASHSYSLPGVYPITLIVTDNDGAPTTPISKGSIKIKMKK